MVRFDSKLIKWLMLSLERHEEKKKYIILGTYVTFKINFCTEFYIKAYSARPPPLSVLFWIYCHPLPLSVKSKSKIKDGLATLLEGVNNEFFKVNLKNFFLILLWVLICCEFGESDIKREAKGLCIRF